MGKAGFTSMRFLILFALAVALHAQDLPSVKDGKLHVGDGCLGNTECGNNLKAVEALTKQVADQKQENERLTKMLNAYAQKYSRCDQELTVMQTLGVQAQPTRPQPRPVKPEEPKK